MSPLLEKILDEVTEARLRAAVHAVTAIPSPTGREAPLARLLAERLGGAGFAATAQHLDEHQANAVGRLRGAGGPGAQDLMLYAPIDTLTTGDERLDVPWIGPSLRPDMRPEPRDEGPYVSGLGASNPKGHAACLLVLAEAFGAVRPPTAGDLVVAFGAGGMPTNAVEAPGYPARANTGQGVGASFLLERGWYTDHAVIAKPGDFVAHDEVGLAWFEVTVPGVHTYAGSRHRLPYRNPIVVAGEVAVALERWLADYPARHRTATAAPQGIIGAIAGGWERMLAVTPALCRLRLDVRVAPGTTPLEIKKELAAFLAGLDDGIGVELVLAIPATATPPDAPVVRRTIAAWEATTGRPHAPAPDNSGATDANILRARGIATARIGMPKVADAELDPDPSQDFSRGMNTVDVRAMRRLCEVLARAALDLTRGGDR